MTRLYQRITKKPGTDFYLCIAFILLIMNVLISIEGSPIEIDPFKKRTINLHLTSMEYYETHLINVVKEMKETKFMLNLKEFTSADSILQFLGLSCKDSKFISIANDLDQSIISCISSDIFSYTCKEKNECSSYSTSSDHLTMEEIREIFQSLTALKLKIDDSIGNVIIEQCQEISSSEVGSSLKVTYDKFSVESKSFVLKEIENCYPNSILAQCLKKLDVESVDMIFPRYNDRLDSLLEQSDDKSEKLDHERRVLQSMLITLFLDKIAEGLFQKLRVSPTVVNLTIDSKIPIFFNIDTKIMTFCDAKISLLGSYFTHSRYSFMQFVNCLNISSVMEVDENLWRKVVNVLSGNSIEDNEFHSGQENISVGIDTKIFTKVKHLKLINISNPSDIEKIKWIQQLPNLEMIEFNGTHKEVTSILRILNEVIDSTPITSILYYLDLPGQSKYISMNRTDKKSKFYLYSFSIDSLYRYEIARILNESRTTDISATNSESDNSSDEDDDSQVNEEASKKRTYLINLVSTLALYHTVVIFDEIEQEISCWNTASNEPSAFNEMQFIGTIKAEVYDNFKCFKSLNLNVVISELIKRFFLLTYGSNSEFRKEKYEIIKRILVKLDARYKDNFKDSILNYKPIDMTVSNSLSTDEK